jgi:hypothetical protein
LFGIDETLLIRFPAVALALAESPGSDLFFPHTLDTIPRADHLYVYGVTPHISLRLLNWLEEHPKRKIVFLEDNPEALTSLVRAAPAWLAHPQFDLSFLPQGPARALEIERLALLYPLHQLQIIPLRKKGFRPLQLALLRQTTLTASLEGDKALTPLLLHHFLSNAPRLQGSFFVNRMKGALQGHPAILCGAGPSLDDIDLEASGALLIACGSAMAALSSRSIRPHLVLAVDPNYEELLRFRRNFAFETPLLYTTRLIPEAFSYVNGPFGYIRAGIGGPLELWLDEQLGLNDPLIGADLSCESLSSTCLALAVAEWLGCNPIYLAGVDLAYLGGHRYAQGIVEDRSIEENLHPMEKRIRHRGVDTAIKWIMEASALGAFAKSHPSTSFFNLSRGLPISHIPAAPPPSSLPSPVQALLQAIESAFLPPLDLETPLRLFSESLRRTRDHLHILSARTSPVNEVELEDELAYTLLLSQHRKKKGESLQDHYRELFSLIG